MEDKGRKRISPVLIVIVLVMILGGLAVYWVTSSDGAEVSEPGTTEVDPSGLATSDGAQQPDVSGAATAPGSSPGGGPGPEATGTSQSPHMKQVDEETFIRISVDVVIAAMGFKNVGQGNTELIDFMPEIYKKYGVTEDAYKQAADLISADNEQSERVAKAVIDRAEKLSGVKMGMDVLPVMTPEAAGD